MTASPGSGMLGVRDEHQGRRRAWPPWAAALALAGCSGGSSRASAAAGEHAGGSSTHPAPWGPGRVARRPPSTSVEAPGFTLVATGDLLIHGPVAKKALQYGHGKRYDFTPMLTKVRAQIAGADLALCHIETPLSADDKNISGYPRLQPPPHRTGGRRRVRPGTTAARRPRTTRSTRASPA